MNVTEARKTLDRLIDEVCETHTPITITITITITIISATLACFEASS